MSNQLPVLICAEAAVKSKRPDYVSLFDPKANIKDLKKCRSDPEIMKETAKSLKEVGFGIMSIGRCSISLLGLPSQFEEIFDCSLSSHIIGEPSRATVLGVSNNQAAPTPKPSALIPISDRAPEQRVAHLLLSQPLFPSGAKRNGDTGGRMSDIYLDEIRALLGEDDKSKNVSGKDVVVAIIDSGLNSAHDFFTGWKTEAKRLEPDIFSAAQQVRNSSLKQPQDLKKQLNKYKKSYSKSTIWNKNNPEDWSSVKALVDSIMTCFEPDLRNEVKAWAEAKDTLLKRIDNAKDSNDKNDVSLVFQGIEVVLEKYTTNRKKELDAFVDDAKADSQDRDGHGTAVCANLKAVASNVSLTSYKGLTGRYANEKALVESDPELDFIDLTYGSALIKITKKTRVVNCSFGSYYEDDNEFRNAAIKVWRDRFSSNKLSRMVIVVGSGNAVAGKSVQANLNLPHVISVGGAFWDDGNSLGKSPLDERKLTASSGAQGYRSEEPHIVPTICGLVAQPAAISADDIGMIWCPTHFGAKVQWERSTGTSLAAPQIAGVCALILQKWPLATPEDVCSILIETSTLIMHGKTFNGFELGKAGIGLVHIGRAVALADFASKIVESNDNLESGLTDALESPPTSRTAVILAELHDPIVRDAIRRSNDDDDDDDDDDLILSNGTLRLNRKLAFRHFAIDKEE